MLRLETSQTWTIRWLADNEGLRHYFTASGAKLSIFGIPGARKIIRVWKSFGETFYRSSMDASVVE